MSTNAVETTYESGRHPVNIGHLVMGLAFLGLLGIWGLVVSDTVDDDNIRFLMPLPWVLAGAVGLVAMTLTSRRNRMTATNTHDIPNPEELR